MGKAEGPTASRAYQLTKDKIIRNELDPRQKLSEIELAKELDISRTPVREALIMLEKDGLITRYEGTRGFYLKQFSLKDIQDLYEFREMIEVAAAARIIENVTDRHIGELAAILQEVETIIEDGRPADALVKALDFHIHCVQTCTNNPFITYALRNCYEKLTVVSWTCHDINACISGAKEHHEILDALRARDLNKLVERSRHHVHRARDRMMDTLKLGTKRLYFMP
ncbi:MAG: GntR family transcriptional regulator [Deltaproteobacteria bacterium]|nr:GntR family transcriptional regulator [Deltaproteobacteria bacterium]